MASHFISLTLAFFVSLLPEGVKERPSLQTLNLPSMHVLSGAAELIVSAALFLHGLGRYLATYHQLLDERMGAAGPTSLDHGQLAGLTLLGYTGYFSQPFAWLYLYGAVEGLVRAVAAFLTDRTLGTAAILLLLKCSGAVKRIAGRGEGRNLLEPEISDIVRPPEKTRSGALEIYSATVKPWSDRQILEYCGENFILAETEFTPERPRHAHCYRFRRLKPGEIIRGSIIGYSGVLPQQLAAQQRPPRTARTPD